MSELSPAMALTVDDHRVQAIHLAQDTSIIIESAKPVFQSAYIATTDPTEQQAIMDKWTQFTALMTQAAALPSAMMLTINELVAQRNVSVHRLDELLSQIERATQDQWKSTGKHGLTIGEDDSHITNYTARAEVYPAEVLNLVEAVEDRLNTELEYERADMYLNVSASVGTNTLANIAALMCGLLDANAYPAARLTVDYLATGRQLTTRQERQTVAGILRALAQVAESENV